MKRFKRIGLAAYASAALILLALLAWPSAARALECVTVTPDEIANLFVRWNDALQKPQPEHPTPDAVIQLYATDAVLLPTVENGPYIGHADIRKYFEHFLENKPSGTILGPHNIRIGCNIAFDAGLYIFAYRKEGKKPTAARYTYVYKYEGGGWLIAHHHSSQWPLLPEPIR
jgi:uncharacterized protein (TIGR02246 family)